jgi:DNA helicase II / ATP-dependent DNA helicase PcrA
MANSRKISPIDVVEGIVADRLPDIKPPAKRKLIPFVSVIRRLRRDAAAVSDISIQRKLSAANLMKVMLWQGVTPDELLRTLIDQVQYAQHLQKSEEDHESRMENVHELINFAAQEHTTVSIESGLRTHDNADLQPEMYVAQHGCPI